MSGDVEATVGGVLMCDENVYMFGSKVDDILLQKWLTELSHPVGLTELYGVLVALKIWRHHLVNRRVIVFCDNWTAIDVFVKGSSPLRLWRELLLELEYIDKDLGALIWMARVASQSNVADPPSRGKWDEVEFMKPYELCFPSCPITGRALESLNKS